MTTSARMQAHEGDPNVGRPWLTPRRAAVIGLALAGVLVAAACSAQTADTATGGTAPASSAAPSGNGVDTSAPKDGVVRGVSPADFKIGEIPNQAGVQHLRYSYGPIAIQPGQNNITVNTSQVPKPTEDGYIVAIRPNLVRNDGSVPPVDVIHLHHGVWIVNHPPAPEKKRGTTELLFASGEEKTVMALPAGYGYVYKAADGWTINYMLHNLLSTPDSVSIVYDLDFIPATDPAAAKITPARPIWMDVQSGHIYPVFDVLKGTGTDGTFTYPDQAKNPYGKGEPLNEWTVDKDSTLIATAGHLHPGGLHTDMYVQRPGAGATASEEAKASVAGDKAHVFRSEAAYYEPAGAVSWDVSMTGTQPDWRVNVKKGDTISISATYDTTRASWYESMGIMIVWATDGNVGADPFQKKVDARGLLTHGHLPETDNHGGADAGGKFADMTKLPNGKVGDSVTIADFTYAPGDMSGIYTDVPTVKPGQSLKFINKDSPIGVGIWHTITACKAPCDQSTGVAYPLADADVQFDSGELGQAGPPTADRVDWSIPTDLPQGTYTYFCRIHPSMRGAFRVDPNAPAPDASASTKP